MDDCPENDNHDLILGICFLKGWSQGDSISLQCGDSHQFGVQAVLSTRNFLAFRKYPMRVSCVRYSSWCLLCTKCLSCSGMYIDSRNFMAFLMDAAWSLLSLYLTLLFLWLHKEYL